MLQILKKTTNTNNPSHVAIIMDGNGRWARKRGLPRVAGHKKGAEVTREIISSAAEMKIKYLTLYAFSSENWQRPAEEVSSLMDLLKFYLENEIKTFVEKGIKLKFIGDISKLSADIKKRIHEAELSTQNNTRLTVAIALSYGSRQEITNAVRQIANDVQSGKVDADKIDEKYFESFLYTNDFPELDLLIRTGGEQRLSNFLLWQSAYTELFFTKTLWPDFKKEDLEKAVLEFSKRERRYGTS